MANQVISIDTDNVSGEQLPTPVITEVQTISVASATTVVADADIPTQVSDALAADPTVVAAAEAAADTAATTVVTDLLTSYAGVLPVATDGQPYPLVEVDSVGFISRYVDADGSTWVKLNPAVVLNGAQLSAGSITADKINAAVGLPAANTDDQYLFAIGDQDGRVSELAIGLDGRLPQWAVDAIVSRANATPLSPTKRTYSLKLDGTGDFTTLATAISTLGPATASQPVEIVIHPGVHTSYEQTLPDHWVLRGVNQLLCRVHGENVDSAIDSAITNNSTLVVRDTNELHNLTITARNMRYVVHDESGGTATDGVVTTKNCHIEHLGNQDARDWRTANPGSGLSPSTVWGQEAPWGYGTSSGNQRFFYDTTLIGAGNSLASGVVEAAGLHDNKDFVLPAEHYYQNCDISAGFFAGELTIQSLGSQQWSRVSMLGCALAVMKVMYYDQPYISVADAAQVAEHSQIEVSIDGVEPIGFATSNRGKALKIESASTATGSKVRVSGTGADAVFGVSTTRDGGGGLKGYIFGQWDISGILCGLNEDTAAKNTLGKRLGNCASVNKTLTVTVDGGAPIDTVFSTDMTAVSNATIIATINSSLGSAASASEYLVTQGETYPNFTGRIKRLVNRSVTVGIPRWSAVKRDPVRGVQLMGTADAAALLHGVALDPIPPGKTGRILTSGRLDTATQMRGLSTTVAAGSPVYHSDATAGAFSLTGTRQAGTVHEAGWAMFNATG